MNEYTHRKNSDGSFDSICMSCDRTVGSTPTEEKLADLERAHVCSAASMLAHHAHGNRLSQPLNAKSQ